MFKKKSRDQRFFSEYAYFDLSISCRFVTCAETVGSDETTGTRLL